MSFFGNSPVVFHPTPSPRWGHWEYHERRVLVGYERVRKLVDVTRRLNILSGKFETFYSYEYISQPVYKIVREKVWVED